LFNDLTKRVEIKQTVEGCSTLLIFLRLLNLTLQTSEFGLLGGGKSGIGRVADVVSLYLFQICLSLCHNIILSIVPKDLIYLLAGVPGAPFVPLSP
jgi:hypothetical protein